MHTFLRFPALALVAALAVAAVGCDSSNPDDDDDPPSLIASGAFNLDAGFPDPPTSAQGGTYANYFQGSARVALVSLAIGTHLVVPKAATAAAAAAQPFVEGGTWIWSNTVPINGSNVTFRLEGTPDGTTVDWRMRITAADIAGQAYDEFVLYEAETALNGRSGSWQLYYRIDGERTRVLDADFTATGSTAGELTFSVPESNPNPDARGASVTYEADGDARLFDWREATAGQTHLVMWSESTHAGSVTAWNYNGGARACWDATLQDTACTPAVQ